MVDAELLKLFSDRDERAITETDRQYGTQCRRFAERILGSKEDAEECVNDVLLQAWNVIPLECPENLPAFLNTLTRNNALNRRKHDLRIRRGGGQIPAVLDELAECIPAAESVEEAFDRRCFLAMLEQFLDTLPQDARVIFVRRYWHMNTCAEIADAYQMRESKVRVTLMRTRRKLKVFLEKEHAL